MDSKPTPLSPSPATPEAHAQKPKRSSGWGCWPLLALFALVLFINQFQWGPWLPKGSTLRYPPPIGAGCKGWDWLHPYISEMAYVLDGSSSPDVVRLAISSGTDLALYDPATGKVRWCINHNADAAAMAVSPDGRSIALRVQGTYIELHQVSNGKKILTLEGLEQYVFDIDFSPDGKILAATDGSSLHVWNLEYPNAPARVLAEDKYSIQAAAFSPDGRTLAAGVGADMLFWDTRDWSPAGTWEEIGDWLAFAKGIQYTPDGRSIIIWLDEGLLVLDTRNGKEIYRWMEYSGPRAYVSAFALSPDGKYLAVMGHSSKEGYAGPGRVRFPQSYYWLNLWRTEGWEYIGMATEDKGGELVFSPDSRSLAADWNGQVHIWEVETLIKTLSAEKSPAK